jgi:hypothetical protein
MTKHKRKLISALAVQAGQLIIGDPCSIKDTEAAQRAYAEVLRARQRDALCLTPERCALRYGWYRTHCHKCQAEKARMEAARDQAQ